MKNLNQTVSISNIRKYIGYLPLFFTFSGLLLLESATKDLVRITLFSVVFCQALFYFQYKRFYWNIDKISLFFIAMLFYFLLCKISYGFSTQTIRVTACIAIMTTALPRPVFSFRLMIFLTQSASYIIFFFCLWIGDRYLLPLNPISYSTIIATLLVINLYFLTTESKYRFLYVFGSVASCYSLVFAETRGTSLAVMLSLIVMILLLYRQTSWRLLIQPIILFAICFVFFTVNNDHMMNKIERASNFVLSGQNDEAAYNITSRLELWKASLYIIPRHPVTGVGQNIYPELKDLVDRGIVNPNILELSHFHNQFISTFVKNGLVGVLFLIALWIYPLLIMKKHTGREKDIIFLLVSVYFFSGLTDIPLSHGVPLFFYVQLGTYILSVTRDENNYHKFECLIKRRERISE